MPRHVSIYITDATLNLNGHVIGFNARRSGVGQPVPGSVQVSFAKVEESPDAIDSEVIAAACAQVGAVAGDVVSLVGGCGRQVVYEGA